jgi:hypothetical protein
MFSDFGRRANIRSSTPHGTLECGDVIKGAGKLVFPTFVASADPSTYVIPMCPPLGCYYSHASFTFEVIDLRIGKSSAFGILLRILPRV